MSRPVADGGEVSKPTSTAVEDPAAFREDTREEDERDSYQDSNNVHASPQYPSPLQTDCH